MLAIVCWRANIWIISMRYMILLFQHAEKYWKIINQYAIWLYHYRFTISAENMRHSSKMNWDLCYVALNPCIIDQLEKGVLRTQPPLYILQMSLELLFSGFHLLPSDDVTTGSSCTWRPYSRTVLITSPRGYQLKIQNIGSSKCQDVLNTKRLQKL